MDALTQAYQSELKRTRLAVSGQVGEMFKALPNYYDEQVPVFLSRAVPVIQAGQQRAISLTSAYTSRQLGVGQVGLDIPEIIGGIRNGVTADMVYARPFVTVRAAIDRIGLSGAVQKGLARAVASAAMDVALASRNASLAYAKQNTDITAWQRVAEPGCCDFCQEIDGAKLLSEDPAPLHNNCGCTVSPLTFGRGYTKSDFESSSNWETVAIHDHGELGPLITNKENNFTALDDFSRLALKRYQAEIDA